MTYPLKLRVAHIQLTYHHHTWPPPTPTLLASHIYEYIVCFIAYLEETFQPISSMHPYG